VKPIVTTRLSYSGAILLSTSLLCASETGPDPVLLHNGVQTLPLANLSYAHERLKLHPYILFGGGYDDNPRQESGSATDDVFFDWSVGCAAAWDGVDRHLGLIGALFQRRYHNIQSRDRTGGSLDVRYRYHGPDVDVSTRLKWDRSDDPTIATGRSLERDVILANALITRPGNRSRGESEIRLVMADYREDATGFRANDRDLAVGEWRFSQIALGDGGQEWGIHLTGLGGRYLDAASPFQNYVGGRLNGSGRWPLSESFRIQAHLGIEGRAYGDPYRGDDAYDDATSLEPIGGASATWSFGPTGIVRLAIASQLAESTTSNFARDTRCDATISDRILTRWQVGALIGASAYHDHSGGNGPTYQAQEVRFGGNVTYDVYPGVTTDLRVLWRNYDADPGQTYDQTVITLQLAIVL